MFPETGSVLEVGRTFTPTNSSELRELMQVTPLFSLVFVIVNINDVALMLEAGTVALSAIPFI
jgi:hypothetical protein